MRSGVRDASNRRQQKMKEVLRRELYEVIRDDIKDPRVSSVTITEVDLKPDLKSALIYVCKFKAGVLGVEIEDLEPTEAEKTSLVEGLAAASHFIYEKLKRRLPMKVIPSLRFEYDHGILQASRVWNLIHYGSR